MTDLDATGAALLAAVRAAPHDDLPRLVFADWLDDTGDPADAAWAELIRVQCRLSEVPGSRRRGEAVRLRNAERRLLTAHGAAWVGPVAAVFGMTTFGDDYGYRGGVDPAGRRLGWVFRRGFLDAVWLPARLAVDHLPAVVRLPTAVVTRVGLEDCEPYFNGAGFGWFRLGRRRPSEAIPIQAVVFDEAFERLTDWLTLTHTGRPLTGRRYRVYATAAAAVDGLSRAVVSWAADGERALRMA